MLQSLRLAVITFVVTIFLTWTRAENVISLSPTRNFVEVIVNPGAVFVIRTTNVSSAVAYSIVQANVYIGTITLSYNHTLVRGYHTNGTNIGLVIFNDNSSNNGAVYLRNLNTGPVDVLVGLQVYDSNAPIPGACNMEQSIQLAPFLPTSYTMWMLNVEYPPASWPLDVNPPPCGGAPLQYDIYHYHLPEGDTSHQTLFHSIRLMSTWKSIEKHGRKVVYLGQPISRVELANYIGTGTVVAIVVRGLTSSAAYVPTSSFGCSLSSDLAPCTLFPGMLDKLFAACLLFLGIILTFFGHRFFKCQAFLLGLCLAATLTTSVLFVLRPEVNFPLCVIGLGVLGGLAVLGIWTFFGAPIVPVFLGTLILGILFSSIVMYTPLVDLDIFRDNLTFWLAFAALVLILPLILISSPVFASIVNSSLVGSYLFIFPLNQYMGSNLNFVILNFLRRATEPAFGSAIIDPPFQTPDLVFAILWFVVALGGIIFQIRHERLHSRAPFPPPPSVPSWPTWLTTAKLREFRLRRQSPVTVPTETTPLLA